MYSFMLELDDALSSRGCVDSLHHFKELHAMLCVPQVQYIPGKAVTAGKPVHLLRPFLAIRVSLQLCHKLHSNKSCKASVYSLERKMPLRLAGLSLTPLKFSRAIFFMLWEFTGRDEHS